MSKKTTIKSPKKLSKTPERNYQKSHPKNLSKDWPKKSSQKVTKRKSPKSLVSVSFFFDVKRLRNGYGIKKLSK